MLLLGRSAYVMKRTVIYTDMDGTLLDHHSYSHKAADPLLLQLDELSIPVIPTTSKTFSEVLKLRIELNNQHPFICENGAAVYIPQDYFPAAMVDLPTQGDFYVKSFVEDRRHWQSVLAKLPARLQSQFITFADMGIEGVMALTGLPRAQAEQSSDRHYGEPIQWLGNDQELHQLRTFVEQEGGKLLVGGRFVHVSGATDKGRALNWLTQCYQQHWGQSPTTIGLGDGGNDIAMLATVDYPIIVRSPVQAPPELPDTAANRRNLITTKSVAPQGWVEGVTTVLSKLDISK